MAHEFDWLYIIFINDDSINEEHKAVDRFFNIPVFQLEHCHYNNKVKLILIQSKPLSVRNLSRKEKKILGESKRKFSFLFESIVFESISEQGKIGFKKIHNALFWQNCFDFVFTNFKAKKYALHTLSHSTGFEINTTDKGFALNTFGNNITHGKISELPSGNDPFFKIFFKAIEKENTRRQFLFTKKVKNRKKQFLLYAIRRRDFKKWPDYNNTNGLLFYDFAKYLSSTGIKLEYMFLNNCDVMLYQNIYVLNGIANFVLGSTGFIIAEFINAGIIYTELSNSQKSSEDSIKFMLESFFILEKNANSRAKIVDPRHYSIIRASNITALNKKFFLAMAKITTLMQTEVAIQIKNLINSPKGINIPIISSDSDKPFYEILAFLHSFVQYNPDTLEPLIKDFEEELINQVICDRKSNTAEFRYLSVCLPNHIQMLQRLTYIRNFFKSPYNTFSKKTGYDSFILRALL